MADHVSGKVIIVTGAASGFGRLVAETTAARGARLVCVDVAEDVVDLVESIRSNNGEAIACLADVTDGDAMAGVAAEAVDRYQTIDVMVNNAGVMPLAFYADHKRAASAWSRCIDINIKGVLNGIAAVYDTMAAQGRGHVINLSSIYGNYPVAGAGVYGATKAAVNFLSESLRVESQGKIKVTTVKPTGVPGTNLGSGVINDQAIIGIVGQNADSYFDAVRALAAGEGTPNQADPDDPQYLALAPEYIAQAIVAAIDQPWGVVTGDITVRATGDGYIL